MIARGVCRVLVICRVCIVIVVFSWFARARGVCVRGVLVICSWCVFRNFGVCFVLVVCVPYARGLPVLVVCVVCSCCARARGLLVLVMCVVCS